MRKKELTNFKSAYNYALRLLSRADYTSKMIERKLLARSLPKDISDEVIDELVRAGYINNDDYGRKFITDMCNLKNKGKIYIEFELSKKGFSKDEIFTLMNECYKSSIEEALAKILFKLNKPVKALDAKELNSVKRKLLSQGYFWDEIGNLLGRMEAIE